MNHTLKEVTQKRPLKYTGILIIAGCLVILNPMLSLNKILFNNYSRLKGDSSATYVKNNFTETLKKSQADFINIQTDEFNLMIATEKSATNLVVFESKNQKGELKKVGNGFFILPNVIVTNSDVLENEKNILFHFINNKQTDTIAEIIAVDKSTHLTLVRPKTLSTKSPFELANSIDLSIGSKIYLTDKIQNSNSTLTESELQNKIKVKYLEYFKSSSSFSTDSNASPVLDSSGKVVGVVNLSVNDGSDLITPSYLIARLILRTEKFYPLNTNPDLKKNPSIESLFPKVCNYLVDFNLPDKDFFELAAKDIKDKYFLEQIKIVMPTINKLWFNKNNKKSIFIGSEGLNPSKIKTLSSKEFKAAVQSGFEEAKVNYFKKNPEAKFKLLQDDTNNNLLKYEFDMTYNVNGESHTDYHKIYFILPYCKIDTFYSIPDNKKATDTPSYQPLVEQISKQLDLGKNISELFKLER